MFKHPSHRQLKNRALKRRVSSHQYNPDLKPVENDDYQYLRANQTALNKLKRQPELLNKIRQNLESKQQLTPEQPQLNQWQQLLERLLEEGNSIESLADEVMGCGKKAEQLRRYSILDCLFD